MISDHLRQIDAQFSTITPHLPNDTRGKTSLDDRRMIKGIVKMLK